MSLTHVEVTSGEEVHQQQRSEDSMPWCSTASATAAEVFWTCSNHALSTEAEEIMGLLLGDVIVSPCTP